jgi:hypothetical protein
MTSSVSSAAPPLGSPALRLSVTTGHFRLDARLDQTRRQVERKNTSSGFRLKRSPEALPPPYHSTTVARQRATVRTDLDTARAKPDNALFERLSTRYRGSYGAQLGAHVSKCEFLLFARNLANAHNRVNAFEFLNVPTQVLQEPRTIGLTLRWSY